MAAFRCTILAGPNGSGKSSIYARLSPPGEFVNADVIESSLALDLPGRKIRAGKMAVIRLQELIRQRADFTFETTLSSQHALRVMSDAKSAGYDVGLIFVTLDSPDRNLERVRFRVLTGGHDIPEADIYRRYAAALRNLPAAIARADEIIVVDNSGEEPVPLLKAGDGTPLWTAERPNVFQAELIRLSKKALSAK